MKMRSFFKIVNLQFKIIPLRIYPGIFKVISIFLFLKTGKEGK